MLHAMKAIIPMAGKGTRLRPHTYTTPKPLVHVGGRAVMSYVLDDLQAIGVTEMVFVVGYLQDEVRAYMAEHYPDIDAHYVVQEVQDGTAGAVKLAEPYVDDEVIILFVDTLFEADLSLVHRLDEGTAGIIWAKEVEDYHRYGVIVTDETGAMTSIVEKPTEPISKLANIGFYFIRDYELLFEGINKVVNSPPGPSGEFYLTDAFQYMVDHGSRIEPAPVQGWYDCGKPEALLDTNRFLLEKGRGGIDGEAVIEDCEIVEPVRIESGVVARGSRIGPNVTLEAGSTVTGSQIQDSMVGANSIVENSRVHGALIGEHVTIRDFQGSLSVMSYSEVLSDVSSR
jgi:glucose-1-phosphate thymidylyltransferase